MTEQEVNDIIKDLPIGAQLEVIMKNGDVIDVNLSSHETAAKEAKEYSEVKVPELPPALIVKRKRWASYRIELENISNIVRVG